MANENQRQSLNNRTPIPLQLSAATVGMISVAEIVG
jgi:hypothetical protein